MTERNRFCVQFAGSQPHCAKKTRLLYSDSQPDDIREIWKLIYNSNDSPSDIEIITGNQTSYLISDKDDFQVFVAMAEDQYRLVPAKPLSVVISVPGEYRPSPPFCTPSPDHVTLPASISYGGKMDGYYKTIEKTPDQMANHNYDNNQSTESRDSSPCAFRHKNLENFRQPKNDFSPPKNFQKDNIENGFQALDFSRTSVDSNAIQPKPLYPANSKSTQQQDLMNAYLPNASSPSAVPVTSTSTLASSLQQQRFLQNSPSASYILQTFLRSNFERAAAMQLASNHQDAKQSFLACSNGADLRTLQEQNYVAANGSDAKKRKRKNYRKLNNLQQVNGSCLSRVMDTSKRMRSSPTQSNIEYHYERAVEYHTMTEEEQKLHNSAHRSHWKHLLFVSKTSPSFLTKFRNAKYDEWSSEARDIFAISKPDKYKWSFLTLSKQGDVLCKRIIERVKDLKHLKAENKPDWCPTNEVLDVALHKAQERLAQLERILFSRTQGSQDENKQNEKVINSSKTNPLSIPALATALSANFFPSLISQHTPEVTKPVERPSPASFPAIKFEKIEESC